MNEGEETKQTKCNCLINLLLFLFVVCISGLYFWFTKNVIVKENTVVSSFVSTFSDCESLNRLSTSSSIRIPYDMEREFHWVQHNVDMEMRRNNAIYGFHPFCFWLTCLLSYLIMSITYFPCFAIAESNRVVFSCSSIVSIESLFELCICNYLSELYKSCDNCNQITSSTGSLTCIASYQLYHIYSYIASEKHILFIATAITLSDSSLIDMLKVLYSIYINSQLKPGLKSRDHNDFGNSSLISDISEQLKQFEKSMSF